MQGRSITLHFIHVICSIEVALIIIGCQAASPGLQPAEKRALYAMFGGTWEPEDADVDSAIRGDTAALHRVFSRSTNPRLDGENLEAQCYHLSRTLFSPGDHRFAEGLRKESQPIQDRVLALLRDTFRQLQFRVSYPETESLSSHPFHGQGA